jgi:hypothetical protein
MSFHDQLRASMKSLLRPVWLMAWRRMEARIRSMELGDASWRQHAPAFLNAVSTVGAFGHELLRYRDESVGGLAALDRQIAAIRAQLDSQTAAIRAQLDSEIMAIRAELDGLKARSHQTDALAARIEFVRREILFEFNHAGDAKNPPTAPPEGQPRVISADKLVASRQSGLRLNLGCGHIPLDGYLNVDMRALPGVDIVAEAGNIPVERGTVQELHSAHLLEHFPQEELRRRLLPYWYSLLSSGGTFKAIVPDGLAMLNHYAAGDYPFEEFREVLFGAQDYHGDFHFNMFVPSSLQSLLEEAGFEDVQVPVQGRRNGLCYEFEINGRHP